MESGDACNTRLALGLGFRELEPPSRRRKTQRALLDQDDDRLLPSLLLGLSEAADRWASRVDQTVMAATKDSNWETLSYSNCSTSPKRSQREVEAADFERRSMMFSDDDEDCSTPRKKLRLSKEQISILEGSFTSQATLNPKQKEDLARKLSLRPRQVEVWFQNRRARIKLKQTEVDCETLKRRCETLREENRRLQEELQELKSQVATQAPFPMQVPGSALPMVCPSCKRVGNKPESSTTGFLISGSTPKSRLCDIRFTNPSAAC